MRKITAENFNEPKPPHATWRRIGAKKHPDYMVRYDRGGLNVGHSHYGSLTLARKDARALVREGRAWAEVFRFWESGAQIGKAFIASYEVEIESGSSVR